MADNLTNQFKAELKRRGITASNTEVSNFISERPDLFNQVGRPMSGGNKLREYEEPGELLGGPIHAIGATLWNAVDTALFSIPSSTMGEAAPYKPEDLGTGAKFGAVLGETAGFLFGFGKLAAGTKALSAAGRYGTKSVAKKAISKTLTSENIQKQLIDSGLKTNSVQESLSKIIRNKKFTDLTPKFELSNESLLKASQEMNTLIKSSLKKDLGKNVNPKFIDDIADSIQLEVTKNGVHLNTIASRVEKALNTKFNIEDSSLISAYAARAAEMSVNFSLYNLTDDYIKSSLVEGHEFDPVSDIGHALLFSAFLPGIDAMPNLNKKATMNILKTRKILRDGINKIKTTDYESMDIKTINALFKILSNNNTLKTSSFARRRATNFHNEYTEKQKDIAIKELRSIYQHFKPEETMKLFRDEVKSDIVNSLPRMLTGALFFNVSTVFDPDILRNVDPETLGAHLLTGALFSRRYKPIRRNITPTLDDFDKKVEFLRILGMDAEQLRLLGRVYDARANMAISNTGLINDVVYRQVNEAFNTKENLAQQNLSIPKGKGEKPVGNAILGSEHKFVVDIYDAIYREGEAVRKILNEDGVVTPDVELNKLTLTQLNKLDTALRKIDIGDKSKNEVKLLSEENYKEEILNIRERINTGNYETHMKLVTEVLDILGMRPDLPPNVSLNMNVPLSIKMFEGLRRFENKPEYETLAQFAMLINKLEQYKLVEIRTEKGESKRNVADFNIDEIAPKINEQFKEFERKILEDNYQEGAILTDFRVEDNAFLNNLAIIKNERIYRRMIDLVDGDTKNLSSQEQTLFNQIYNKIKRGQRFERILTEDKIDFNKEKLNKEVVNNGDEYAKVLDTIIALEDLVNINYLGKIESKGELTYKDAKDLYNQLKSQGWSLTPEKISTFKDFYYKEFVSSELSSNQIGFIKNGIATELFKIGVVNGKKIINIPDEAAARAILGENYPSELIKYQDILKEIKTIKSDKIKIEPEFQFNRLTENNLLQFIQESHHLTYKNQQESIQEYTEIVKRNNDSLGAITSLGQIVERFIDTTDPSNFKAKDLTSEEIQIYREAISTWKKTGFNQVSPELKNFVENLEKRLSLAASAQDVVKERNQKIVLGDEYNRETVDFLTTIIDEEITPLTQINEKISDLLFRIENYSTDAISSHLRKQNLIYELGEMLRRDGIEVKELDGAIEETLPDLFDKISQHHMTWKDKVDKNYKLKLIDFVELLDNHKEAWNLGYTQEQFKEMADRHRVTMEDSSLKSRDYKNFDKLNILINKIKPYEGFFDSPDFTTTKEKLYLAIKNNNLVEQVNIVNKISRKVKAGLDRAYKDNPEDAIAKYEDYLIRGNRELLASVVGTSTIPSVQISYRGNQQYFLKENRLILSNGKLSEFFREFERQGVYVAALEKNAVIQDQFGKARKVGNIFSNIENIESDYINNAKFASGEKGKKYREVEGRKGEPLLSPTGSEMQFIPLSFGTHIVIAKKDFNKAAEIVKSWRDRKIETLKQKDLDLKISNVSTKLVRDNFENLFGSEPSTPAALKIFMKAMHYDKMNSKGFHEAIALAKNSQGLKEHLASNFKYFSVAEGTGAKTSGDLKYFELLKELNNKEGPDQGKFLDKAEEKTVDEIIRKNGKFKVASLADEIGNLDALKLIESRYEEIRQEIAKEESADVRQKMNESLDYTLNQLKNTEGDTSVASLLDRSTVDGLLYAGTTAYRASLIQKARNQNDGVGGIKETISYNDGVNTAILKQNMIYDPMVAAILDSRGIDFLSMDSSSKVWSRKSLKPLENWEINKKSFERFLQESIDKEIDLTKGTKKQFTEKLIEKDYIQEIDLKDIAYVKTQDRHNVVNITYALSETLNKASFGEYLKYADYQTKTSAADIMRDGIVSKGPERFGISEFLLNTLNEQGAVLSGTTTSDVQFLIQNKIDPRQSIVEAPINRALFRTVIDRIRKPETDGGSYSTMIPFLEGSVPFYSPVNKFGNSIQLRFGGKKLSDADGSWKPSDKIEELQFIVNVGEGRELLIGKEENKWTQVGTKKEQLPLSNRQKSILTRKQNILDKYLSEIQNKDYELRTIVDDLKRRNIFIESVSLRMPNLAGDVVINKIEGFYSPEMGNVVGINPLELTTKMQADMDGDMAFNYHNTNMKLTKGLADLTGIKLDTAIYKEGSANDFGDFFQNGDNGTSSSVGSSPDAVDGTITHIQNYYKGKDLFGQIKRFSAGINSLQRNENFKTVGEKQNLMSLISFTDINKLRNFVQKDSNVMQSLIDTTKKPNITNKSEAYDLKRFILFGDIPADNPNFKPSQYRESNFNLVEVPATYTPQQKEIYKDSVIEIIDALGRPSRIMSDIYDSSGRKTPEHMDLIRMSSEIKSLASNPNQFVFDRLLRKYSIEGNSAKIDSLLKMFYDKPESQTTDDLRTRILNNNFKRDSVKVEKNPFVIEGKLDTIENNLFDSSPAGYVLKRIGNVRDSYVTPRGQYGLESKKLSSTLDTIENFVALSNLKTHEQIRKSFEEITKDTDDSIMISLTGKDYRTSINDVKYLEKYSVNYYLLGKEASAIRNYMRRNGQTNSGNAQFYMQKLRVVEALRTHMRDKQDSLISEIIKNQKQKGETKEEAGKRISEEIVEHFGLFERNFTTRNANFYSNTTDSSQYIYKKSDTKDRNKFQWKFVSSIRPRQSKTLYKGNYVILKNPLEITPLTKAETLDAYSLFLLTSKVTPERIRNFSGDKFDIISFINKSNNLKSQISSLASEAYKLSKDNAEPSEIWIKEKNAEDMLVKDFFERQAVDSYQGKIDWDSPTAESRNTVFDIALYLMQPQPVAGKIVSAVDNQVALPSFKVNKRVVSAVLRYLRKNNFEDEAAQISKEWGQDFTRRYSNVIFEDYYKESVYRNKNTQLEERSQVYETISGMKGNLLYKSAVQEALKGEIALTNSNLKTRRDINGDEYQILRLGTYDNIKTEFNIYSEKNESFVSNLMCGK